MAFVAARRVSLRSFRKRITVALLCIIVYKNDSLWSLAEEPLPQNAAGQYLLPLTLALYDPSAVNDNNADDSNEGQKSAVTAALQTIFCTLVQDLILVDEQNRNVCTILDGGNSNGNNNEEEDLSDSVSINSSNATSSSTPSILDAAPFSLDIVPVQDDRFSWTVWTWHFTILQVGDVYIAEALQNQPSAQELDIDILAPAAAQSMRAVLQLTLDVNAMDGTLDALLRSLPPTNATTTTRLFSSPVEEARRRWAALDDDDTESSSFAPRTALYPLRVSGLVLAIGTLLLAGGLPYLAKQRRRKSAPP